jgi:hypothetical protein
VGNERDRHGASSSFDELRAENDELRAEIARLVELVAAQTHADETTDRLGTRNCWMHVVSTGLYTLIHASMTRGSGAIEEAGVLRGYRGVVVHDRLALYWKLKQAKHGLCGAHLLRDLADVAVVVTQTAWATGLATLLVEINTACDEARLHRLKQRHRSSPPAPLRRALRRPRR